MAQINNIDTLFFELLQVAIGTREALSFEPDDKAWQIVMEIAARQTLIGICFAAFQKPVHIPRPVRPQYLKWLSLAANLQRRNQTINRCCAEVCAKFMSDGFDCCVLKGQGNLAYYPDNLKEARTPGDIDLWVFHKDGENNIAEVVDYVHDQLKLNGVNPDVEIRYHHLEMPDVFDIAVEVHFRPCFMDSFIRNRRLQKWFLGQKKSCINDSATYTSGFPVPDLEFNVVYQLSHIFRHYFDEGVGMRQILDYYMVVKAYSESTSRDDSRLVSLLRYLGLRKFAGAVMYVLQEALNAPDDHLYVKPDMVRGCELLDEIMLAGNFGQYDKRIKKARGCGLKKLFVHFNEKLKRVLRLFPSYPEAAFCEPLFRVYHFVWRKLKLWNY